MPTNLTVTITGPDRPGIVDAIANTLSTHDANWEESRMSRLGGQFAGIVTIEVPSPTIEQLKGDLLALQSDQLTVVIAEGTESKREPGTTHLQLDLLGQDRPGIVHEVAHVLASRGVSIESIETRAMSASWSADRLFRATADLLVPDDFATSELRDALEDIANELMIDIELDRASVADFDR